MSRAANGRSSIVPGKDGRWHGYVSLGTGPNGKPVRKHVAGRTKSAVTEKVTELEAQRARNGGRAASGPLRVGDWLAEWLVVIERTRKPRYHEWAESLVRSHAEPISGIVLTKLTVRDIDELLFAKAAEVSSGRAAALHRCLRAALNVAVKRGVATTNPCVHATVPRAEEPEIEPLLLHEVKGILAAADKTRMPARWSVALALGLRQGEALGLRWSDIDLDGGSLSVAQQFQRIAWKHNCRQATPDHKPSKCPERSGGGWKFETVKSKAGRRTVALPEVLADQLREHRRRQATERLAAGSAWQDYDLVFARADGHPLHPTVDNGAWRRLLAAASIRPARLHDARHTAATLLLYQGVDGRIVMSLLGWSQVSLLARYQHVIDPMRREAATKMGAAIWG
ncbi:MAG: tyrosine-type recombinase/integrase [Nocardioides sp.]